MATSTMHPTHPWTSFGGDTYYGNPGGPSIADPSSGHVHPEVMAYFNSAVSLLAPFWQAAHQSQPSGVNSPGPAPAVRFGMPDTEEATVSNRTSIDFGADNAIQDAERRFPALSFESSPSPTVSTTQQYPSRQSVPSTLFPSTSNVLPLTPTWGWPQSVAPAGQPTKEWLQTQHTARPAKVPEPNITAPSTNPRTTSTTSTGYTSNYLDERCWGKDGKLTDAAMQELEYFLR